MTQLTDRQEAIKELIDKGLSAREIAGKLNISRNAVYQQISALKKKGALAPGFTPSGETRIPPRRDADADGAAHAEQVLRYVTGAAPDQSQAPALEAIRELVAMNRDLVQVITDLSARLGARR